MQIDLLPVPRTSLGSGAYLGLDFSGFYRETISFHKHLPRGYWVFLTQNENMFGLSNKGAQCLSLDQAWHHLIHFDCLKVVIKEACEVCLSTSISSSSDEEYISALGLSFCLEYHSLLELSTEVEHISLDLEWYWNSLHCSMVLSFVIDDLLLVCILDLGLVL